MDSQPPEPMTERVGGGFSARLAAVLAVGLLLSVVWLGLSGRTDRAPAGTPAVVGLASPSPRPLDSPALASPSPSRNPSPTATPGPVAGEQPIGSSPLVIPRRYGPLGDDAFAVTVWLEGRFYMNVLREQSPGQLSAVMRLPLFPEMPTTTLEVIQLWTRDDRPALADIADYDLPLGELLVSPSPEQLLEVERDPRPRKRNAPRLIREGYRLTVGTDVRRDHAFLLFELTVGDAQAAETGTDRLIEISRDWDDFGRRLPGRGPHDEAVIRQAGGHPPLILLVAQPGTQRGTMVLGHSWLAGY